MWRFTLLWTIITVIGVHLLAASYAVLIQRKNWKYIWLAPFVFGLVGGIEAVIAGNVVGGLYVLSMCVSSGLMGQTCGDVYDGLLSHVDLDSILVGVDQCACADCIFLCGTGWYVM